MTNGLHSVDAEGAQSQPVNDLGHFCFQCKREISGNAWFARVKMQETRVLFCRPRRLEVFLDE